MGKLVLGVLLWAGTVYAEPDGAVADPARWTGPHGPPGNTRRSRAMPITRDVTEAWRFRLPGQPVASPVTWDGTLYITCAAARGLQLLAIDIATGKKLASKTLTKAPIGAIHVWSDVVILCVAPDKIAGYKRVGKTFLERWKYSKGPGRSGFAVDDFTVVENEVFATTKNGALVRITPGQRSPVWYRHGGYTGAPAICGRSVLAVEGDSGALHAFDRSTGEGYGQATRLGKGRGSSHITVGPRNILVQMPSGIPTNRGSANHAFIKYELARGAARIESLDGLMSFKVTAAVHGTGFLTCEGRSQWQHWSERGRVLAIRKYNPDLFTNLVPATVVGKVAYFGSWAADIETGEIFWRVNVPQILFGAIPADRLCLIVDHSPSILAIRSRVGR